MKIGIDIEEIKRFKLSKENTFIKRNFSEVEITYAYSKSKPQQHLCGFFCCKEALKKVLGVSIDMNEISIEHKFSGEPILKINKNFLKSKKISLSISHCEDYAVASVLLY